MFTPASEIIASHLVQLRESAGLTQRQLAKKLKVAPSIVAKVEMGERRLDLHEFYQYCIALNANPAAEAERIMVGFRKLIGRRSKLRRR